MDDCCAKPGLLPVETALQRLLKLADATPVNASEEVALAAADGRVLAQAVVAGLDLPPWDNSAMDGYALRLADAGGEPLAVSQRIFAGTAPSPLQAGRFPRVLTASRCRKASSCWPMGGCVFCSH